VAAYPFSQIPLFADFKKRLIEEYQCEFKTTQFPVNDQVYDWPYFERQFGSRRLRAAAVFKDTDRVEFSDIRRICRTLEVPPAAFGLDLEGWYDADPDETEAVN
jgi:hypothetical protein